MTSLYYQDVQFKVTGIGRIGTVIQKARHESFMTVIFPGFDWKGSELRMNILISSCLLGQYCRYDGKTKTYDVIRTLLGRDDLHFIPICPEQAGGLATPRPPAERCGDRVVTKNGLDVTAAYERGAAAALYLARLFHCTKAILKAKSPSCGCGLIYDGTFSRTLTEGDGVTAALLKAEGIEVFSEGDPLEYLLL